MTSVPFKALAYSITIWNYKATAQDLVLTLYYFHGQYALPIHLGPNESYNLDMVSLVHSRVPDPSGTLIPSNIDSGSAVLAGAGGETDTISVAVSASVFNVRNATCGGQCVNCNGAAEATFDPGSYTEAVGGTAQSQAQVTWNTGSVFTNPSGITWYSANPSIASMSSSGMITGLSPGSTGVVFTLSDYPIYAVDCSNYSPCPYETIGAGGPENVGPIVWSFTPTPMYIGTNGILTITGSGFSAASSASIQISDPNVVVTSVQIQSNTTITANFSVPPNDTAGNYTLSVNLLGVAFTEGGNWWQGPFALQIAPSVSSITPSQGLVGTPINVTISGTGFASGATVTAGSNVSVTNVQIVSSSQITATFTPTNATSAGGNQGVTVTVPSLPSIPSNSQNFYVQVPTHLVYIDGSPTPPAPATPNNGHSIPVSGTNINIINGLGQTVPTGSGVCGGYLFLSYAPTDQNNNPIVNGTMTFTESFSNVPSPDPFLIPTPSSATVNLPGGFLGDEQALWNTSPPGCLTANAKDSFNQQFTPKVGSATYTLTTVITVQRSTNSQGLPSFNVSITTP